MQVHGNYVQFPGFSRLIPVIVVAAALALCAETPGEPPTDHAVFSAIRNIEQRYAELWADDRADAQQQEPAIVAEELSAVDLSAVTPRQMSALSGIIDRSANREATEAFLTSIDRHAQRQDVYGAIALIEGLLIRPGIDDAVFRRALEHPGLAAAMNSRHRASMMRVLMSLEPPTARKNIDGIERSILMIDPVCTRPMISRRAVAQLLETLRDDSIADAVGRQRESIRLHLLSVAQMMLADCAPGTGEIERGTPYLQLARDLADYLAGSASTGELLGNAAPPMEFLWSAGPDAPFNSLEDLRGNVIVLDFWATWCGPCVASFPEIRRLQAQYADDDVVIIGVTSVQGWHVPGGDAEPIDVSGNPQREFELMDEFRAARDMTWNVAFSKQSVINPEYGVWGIPHVTIIDRSGRIRHNGLHPAQTSFEAMTQMIDALLQE